MAHSTRGRTAAQLAPKLPHNLLLYDSRCYYSNDRVTKAVGMNLTIRKHSLSVIHVATRDSTVGRYVLATQPKELRELEGLHFVEKRQKRRFLRKLLPGLAGDAKAEDYEVTVYTKSQAVFRICSHLDHHYIPYVSTACFWLLPRFFTDAVFDWIVRGRYEKFGRSPDPIVATEEIKFRQWRW